MASTTLLIPLATSDLPTCNPNLMPFHINYSGPAQVSAFMRVEKYKRESVEFEKKGGNEMKRTDLVESQDVEMKEEGTPMTRPVLSGAPSTDSVMTEATAVAESQDTIINDTKNSSPPPLEDEDKRFVSTFRGRSIHGLTIDLPTGYSGLVLRAEANPNEHASVEMKKEDPPKSTKGKGKATAGKTKAAAATAKDETKGKPRGRLTRSAAPKRVEEPIFVEDEEEEKKEEDNVAAPEVEIGNLDDTGDPLPNSKPVKKLVPTAQFSSFTLWHADRPVDKGNDEYARTLKEWLALAHEINRTDL